MPPRELFEDHNFISLEANNFLKELERCIGTAMTLNHASAATCLAQ